MACVEYNNLSDFELAHIFECGQCFRWHEINDNKYVGVTKFGVVEVEKNNNIILISGSEEENPNFISFANDYFDLFTNYSEIKEKLSRIDENIKKSIEYGYRNKNFKSRFLGNVNKLHNIRGE